MNQIAKTYTTVISAVSEPASSFIWNLQIWNKVCNDNQERLAINIHVFYLKIYKRYLKEKKNENANVS